MVATRAIVGLLLAALPLLLAGELPELTMEDAKDRHWYLDYINRNKANLPPHPPEPNQATADLGSYRYVGCFGDVKAQRDPVLMGPGILHMHLNATDCPMFCWEWGYLALGNGHECICGSGIDAFTIPTPGMCNIPCGGSPRHLCGGSKRMAVYKNDTTFSPPIVSAVKGWAYRGCLKELEDPKTGLAIERALQSKVHSSPNMTPPMCKKLCGADRYIYAGLGEGDKCFCGNDPRDSSMWTEEKECAIRCSGDPSSICGEMRRLTVYEAEDPPEPEVKAVKGYEYVGCGDDSEEHPAMTAATTEREDLTPKLCSAICADYPYFAVQGGRKCGCGREFVTKRKHEKECTLRCAGDAGILCGGKKRANVYAKSKPPQNKEIVNDKFRYLKCGEEGSTGRVLTGQSKSTSRMNLEKCGNFCSGFTYFGLEYGQECLCGDEVHFKPTVTDLLGKLLGAEANTSESDCFMACKGDESEICGGRARTSVYTTLDLGIEGDGVNDHEKVDIPAPPARICKKRGRCRRGVLPEVSLGKVHNIKECANAIVEHNRYNDLDSDHELKSMHWAPENVCVGQRVPLTDPNCGFMRGKQEDKSWDLSCFEEHLLKEVDETYDDDDGDDDGD